jgi:hypothetical protein
LKRLRLSDLPRGDLARRLRDGKLRLDLPPFVVCLRSDLPGLATDLACLYQDFALAEDRGFADFHLAILGERRPAGGLRPQARFYYDGQPAFLPLPRRHALPMFEWGLNWCVASHAHQYLVMHAAVVERGGRALVLPAPPGSGKSTLTAALALHGWRLLSDELALYDMACGLLWGMARPVNLKNAAIDVIRRHAPQAVLSAPVPDTAKGLVALLKPPVDSVRRVREPATPAWVVWPRYREGAATRLAPASRADTLMLMAEQSFNYDIHGVQGFEALSGLIGGCRCLQFEYSLLDEALRVFDDLAEGRI